METKYKLRNVELSLNPCIHLLYLCAVASSAIRPLMAKGIV